MASCTFQESNLTRFKVNWSIPASWRPSPGSSGSGIAVGSAEKHQILTPEVRGGCRPLGSEVEGGGDHREPYAIASSQGHRKPGQHLQATEASTFCLTWYTEAWATRYLGEEG